MVASSSYWPGEASTIFMDSLSIFVRRSFIGPEAATIFMDSLSLIGPEVDRWQLRMIRRSLIGPEAAKSRIRMLFAQPFS